MKRKEDNADHSAMINEGEENEMEVFGYRLSIPLFFLCVIGYFLSGGVLLLIFYWKPEWSVWANCMPSSLEKANIVLLRTTDERKKYTRKKVCRITLDKCKDLPGGSKCPVISDENSVLNKAIRRPDLKVKFIRVQKVRFVWNYAQKRFQNIGTLEDELSCFEMHSFYGPGLREEEQAIRRLVCGNNTIEAKVAPLWKLFIHKVLNFIYVYQIFAITLMLVEGYLGYAIAILILCTCSMTLSLVELRKQSSKLHKLVKAHNNMKVTVYQRNAECSQVESRHLVPGDVIVLTGKNFFMSCDAVLINGTCVVNEGMLTGESILVTKTQLPHTDNTMPWKQYSGEDYKRHVLFCGTEVIRTESTSQGLAKAVVLRTGSSTTKGDMVRSILYPKPLNFKLYRDVKWFFLFLTSLAIVGIIYTVTIFVQRKVPPWRIFIESLVLVVGAVSPVIPAAMMVGILYAKSRLSKKQVHCISPDRINMCGQINLFCFDKAMFGGHLFNAMATCHSLIMADGKLQGDPLDVKMFEATGWVMDDNCEDISDESLSQSKVARPGPDFKGDTLKGLQILFQYPFSSAMLRMSVIIRAMGGSDFNVYMKGAPETVASFCKAESVPSGFSEELERYTFQGLRVIGVAFKTLKNITSHDELDNLEREEVECDLEFLGLLILENRVKPETKAALEELNLANIKTVMITGDNIQTATTVAKTCGIIPDGGKIILVEACKPDGLHPASVSWKLLEYPVDENYSNGTFINMDNILNGKTENSDFHFSMSGKTYEVLETYFYELLPKILMNGSVFARMSPGQKSTIIDELRKLDYFVGMCGDGANDCAALKMANAGISLSEEEASVAAPFNSQVTNISCVPELIKEGRAALVTSFCTFKYMALVGLVEYINILLLYWQRNIFGNNQWLVHDFPIVFAIFLTMSATPAYPKLAKYRPPGQMMSPSILLSVIFNVTYAVAMQTYAFLMVQQQPWYSKDDIFSACHPGNESLNRNLTYILIHERKKINYESFESTTLWLVSSVHLVILSFVFSKGKPFRQPLYRNYLFVVILVIEVTFNIYFIFADFKKFYLDLELVCTPTSWRIHMIVLLAVNLVVLFAVEELIMDNRALWRILKKCLRLKPGSKYKKLQATLAGDTEWPPIGETIYCSKMTNLQSNEYTNPAFQQDEVPNGVCSHNVQVI
ncbi:probable cation-transporting ATPase 13A4 [Hyperolius riggenbachi]|uniref:probable cation-transporting ATPase 13A4 n=1 Tax=Hyperolius riggenbachi TaxID=752182 RepID=UPI0035A3113C